MSICNAFDFFYLVKHSHKQLKKFRVILLLTSLSAAWACVMQKERTKSLYHLQNTVTYIPGDDSLSIMTASATEDGNAEAGYKYLMEGNAFSSGIPVNMYKFLLKLKDSKLARLAGYNKYTLNDFVVFKNDKGRLTAIPGCLHCHAQQFNNSYVVGLGNSYSNFKGRPATYIKLIKAAMNSIYGKRSDEWKTAERAFEAMQILDGKIQTEMQGPTPAQKIAEITASHRDPVTLKFRADTEYFSVPNIVIPEDPPALWISKKRKALTVNAMRQGGVLKHIVSTSLLTLKDTSEAREIYNHSIDVWAYIKTLKPPPYPFAINKNLAEKGRKIFVQTCSYCHGTYGEKEHYPNKIIPPNIIGTDSLMWKYFIKYTGYTEWFNKSWFAALEPKSFTNPQRGYVPPPLDGVWVTAPYLHNGSVPTIKNVLNSKTRPKYWKRNFNKEEYDYEKLGWRYKTLSKPGGKKMYNTDIPGYGNYGHTFGDHLTDAERKAVIEYLKTI